MTARSQQIAGPAVSLAMPADFLALLKPRVMSLVVFTALVGMAMAPERLPLAVAAVAILAIAIGAGASGALNMWWDADIDAKMARTRTRPIPAGRLAPGEALGFGVVLAAFSIATLGLVANWLAAGLLAFTIFFYAVIYTMGLKRLTPQNIVIGGAAGAFPPVIGWVAATGSMAVEPWVLFAIIFLWTPPHFWALALVRAEDYRRAGVPMLPVVAGRQATQNQIFAYSLALVAAGLSPLAFGMAGALYGIAAALLGAEFLRRALAVWRMSADDASMPAARRLFAFSIFYLFGLFGALLAEAVLAQVRGG
jgi:protoheme IX farnesyltransferase